ncbi:MAG: major capsid protein [Arizlama microvirus]|nr:MAG: major capsid protein [Arizlama microvirus]
MRSATQHQFSQIPRADIPRAAFNRSFTHKTTFDAGLLIPIFVDEALPGDTFSMKATLFARLATPIFPVMDNLYLDTFYFAVPNRLLWDNWQKFMGEKENFQDSNEYFVPQVTTPTGGYTALSMADYMGIPTGVNGMPTISALWFRAYNLIYNEWFRDENLCTPAAVNNDSDGPDDATDYVLRRRGKRHDYFTSALPLPQKGPAVQIPMGTTAPVYGTGRNLGLTNAHQNFSLYSDSSNIYMMPDTTLYGETMGGGYGSPPVPPTNKNIGVGVVTTGVSGLQADLSTATAVTINALREAFQLQKMLERDARGGTRYTEILRAHFNVVSPDSRLQRPELLGLGSCRVNIHPVQQTSGTPATGTPQGNLAGYGIATDSSGGFHKSFVEHCTIIGLACVRADLTYQQGIPRMFSRLTRYDYYWPALAHLGEQEILNQEIFVTGGGSDSGVFGYQERYAEYRYKPSQVTGIFRSVHANSLDSWHYAQEFSGLPSLGTTFIEENPPIDRTIAVQSEPHLIFDSLFDLQCARPMPLYSVPGLIDHF